MFNFHSGKQIVKTNDLNQLNWIINNDQLQSAWPFLIFKFIDIEEVSVGLAKVGLKAKEMK